MGLRVALLRSAIEQRIPVLRVVVSQLRQLSDLSVAATLISPSPHPPSVRIIRAISAGDSRVPLYLTKWTYGSG